MQTQRVENVKNYLLIFLSILIILYLGRTVFIPLSFAVLVSFLLYPICNSLEKRKLSRTFSVFICICILFLIGVAAILFLYQQVNAFSGEWEILEAKIPEAKNQLRDVLNSLGFSMNLQGKWISEFRNNMPMTFLLLMKSFLYSSGEIVVWLILIPLFTALILLNRSILLKSLYGFFKSDYNERIQHILHQIVKAYYDFIKGMMVVYIIVGILNSIGLWIIGIPNPVLFGFIASILTFIPFIGIIIGSLLPISLAWLTYNSIWYPLGVILVFTVVQYLEANLIFPLAVSNRLKISTLATLLSILAGGVIWGAAGMILFVPFVAILKLIADNFPELNSISLLLEKNQSGK